MVGMAVIFGKEEPRSSGGAATKAKTSLRSRCSRFCDWFDRAIEKCRFFAYVVLIVGSTGLGFLLGYLICLPINYFVTKSDVELVELKMMTIADGVEMTCVLGFSYQGYTCDSALSVCYCDTWWAIDGSGIGGQAGFNPSEFDFANGTAVETACKNHLSRGWWPNSVLLNSDGSLNSYCGIRDYSTAEIRGKPIENSAGDTVACVVDGSTLDIQCAADVAPQMPCVKATDDVVHLGSKSELKSKYEDCVDEAGSNQVFVAIVTAFAGCIGVLIGCAVFAWDVQRAPKPRTVVVAS